MKIVEAKLPFQPDTNQQAYAYANSEAGNIQESIDPVFNQVPVCDEKEVFDHEFSF